MPNQTKTPNQDLADLLDTLRQIVGNDHVLIESASNDLVQYVRDWREASGVSLWPWCGRIRQSKWLQWSRHAQQPKVSALCRKAVIRAWLWALHPMQQAHKLCSVCSE